MYLFKYIFFLTHSIFQLLVDSYRRLLLRHYIRSATLYVTCFCHSAFCSLLFSLYVFLIVFICGNITTINLHVLFTSLYFPLMNYQSLLLYDDTLLTPSVCQAICFIVLLIFFVSAVTIYFPVLFPFDFPYCGCNHYSFYHSSFLSSTMYPSLLPLLYFADESQFFLYSTSLYG